MMCLPFISAACPQWTPLKKCTVLILLSVSLVVALHCTDNVIHGVDARDLTPSDIVRDYMVKATTHKHTCMLCG